MSLESLMMRVVVQVLALVVVLAIGAASWLALEHYGAQPEVGAGRGGPGGFASPVEVVSVGIARLERVAVAVGSTRARESIDVVAEVPGRIRAILVEEGQRVETGQVLFELDRRSEEADVRELSAVVSDHERRLQRSLALLQDASISEAQVDSDRAALETARARLSAAEARLDERSIRAPFAGVVGLRTISTGAYVTPGTRLTTLDDLATLRLEFSVPERYLSLLAPGLTVVARSAGPDGREFRGEVRRVATRVDPVSRSVEVQSELPNPDGALLPGMFMTVRLVLGRNQEAVMVPEEALVPQSERMFVFRLVGDVVERVSVVVGQRSDGLVEVIEGLAAGDQVVVSGVQRLRDGAAVRVLGGEPAAGPPAAAPGGTRDGA